jgi:hypothetical protein
MVMLAAARPSARPRPLRLHDGSGRGLVDAAIKMPTCQGEELQHNKRQATGRMPTCYCEDLQHSGRPVAGRTFTRKCVSPLSATTSKTPLSMVRLVQAVHDGSKRPTCQGEDLQHNVGQSPVDYPRAKAKTSGTTDGKSLVEPSRASACRRCRPRPRRRRCRWSVFSKSYTMAAAVGSLMLLSRGHCAKSKTSSTTYGKSLVDCPRA